MSSSLDSPRVPSHHTRDHANVPPPHSPARARRTPSRLGTPTRKTFDFGLQEGNDPQRSSTAVVDGIGIGIGIGIRTPYRVRSPSGGKSHEEDGSAGPNADDLACDSPEPNAEAGPSVVPRRSRGRQEERNFERAELDRQLAELGVECSEDEDEDVFDDAKEYAASGYDLGEEDEGDGYRSSHEEDDTYVQSGSDLDDEDDDDDERIVDLDVGEEERGLVRDDGSSRAGRGSRTHRDRRKGSRSVQDEEADRGGKRTLIEILPSLILAHPLAILPLLPLLPQAFAPSSSTSAEPSAPLPTPITSPLAAISFLILITLIAALSVCVHVVTVYTARYLKVTVWEEVLARGLLESAKGGSNGRGIGEGLTSRFGRRKRRIAETGETELAGLGLGDLARGEEEGLERVADEGDEPGGKSLRYGVWAGQGLQVMGTLGVVVGWLSAVHPLLHPMLPSPPFLASRILWTFLASLTLLPPIIPQRHKLDASRLKEALAILLPVVIFLVIGRTVEVVKAGGGVVVDPTTVTDDGVSGLVTGAPGILERDEETSARDHISAGSAIFYMMLLFSPHMHTLPIHATVLRESRSHYAFAWLGGTASLLVLALPYALVPYFLLFHGISTQDSTPDSQRAGVFNLFPQDVTDGWLNFARLCMVTLILVSVSQWMGNARQVCLRALGVEREGRPKAVRWIAGVMWVLVTSFAALGGWPARKIEDVGFICVMLTGWLIPAIVFVKVFHLSIPLAIVFPSAGTLTSTPALPSLPSVNNMDEEEVPLTGTTAETAVEDDPALNTLLARKERQLQKRRTGRRLWQDLIVMLGILPAGAFGVVWACCTLFGFVGRGMR